MSLSLKILKGKPCNYLRQTPSLGEPKSGGPWDQRVLKYQVFLSAMKKTNYFPSVIRPLGRNFEHA